ncbi:hypothetical protein [Chryseobacterium populi]|uniref:YD repeat-containing protein n=1 Tax=Chryseobacterium populi TaxID=1144316 RepID=J2JZK4_9FLAO|nr:hypothetical protein [Chryseobacterium populi]EJL73320.1 hypothetical protein PMI13_01573 [Chryseobacterium populi]
MKKSIILSFVLGMLFPMLQAQDKYSSYYFKNYPNSPSTATFLRYGELQNSEYTGTNSPQIPLFTAESGTIKIPLILKYISGNGIKVAQEAGSVGLGWDISLPTITQSILGGYSDFGTEKKYLADFTKSSNPFNNYFPHSAQPLPSGFVSQPTKDAYSYYKTIDGFLPLNGNFVDLNNSFQADTDTSPDIFTCNLFGEKLEFVISNYPTNFVTTFTPTFYCLNKKGYKISYSTSTFFTIIDPQGTKYYFSRVEDVRTLTSVSKNYVITKISDINNNDINFVYNEFTNVQNLPSIGQKLNYTYGNQTYNYPSLPLANSQTFTWIGEFDEQYPGSSANPLNSSQSIGFTPSLNTSSTKQNYLLINNISGNFGKVNFYYSDRVDFPTQKLDKIEELNIFNQIVNKINFNYDYFNSQSSANIVSSPFYQGIIGSFYQSLPPDRLTKRLKLLSIVINNETPYTFGYNETLLPSKHSTGVDYWGYSNGGFTNKTLFLNPNDFNYPTAIPIDNNYNNNFKQADLNYTQSAILNKIIYPTKGYSSFEYELNTASNLFYQYDYGKLTVGNGLRMKSQTNKDSNDQFIGKTELQYVDGISTNPAFLFNKNTYSTIFFHPESGSGDSQSAGVISMNSNNNNSSSPIASGDYIGYSKVIKTEKDAQNSSKGAIETNYSNTSDFHYFFQDGVIPINMPSSKSPNSTENGKVLSEIVYDSFMNKIQQTDNTYSEIYSNVFYGTSLSRNSRSVWNSVTVNSSFVPQQHGVTVLGYYPIFSKESLLSQSVKNEYSNNKVFTIQTNYSYSAQNNLTQKLTNFPDGGTESTVLLYAHDMSNQKLVNVNMVSIPLRKTISKGGQDYSSFWTKYDDTSHLNPTSVQESSQVQPPNYIAESKTVVTYTSYDNKGNLLEYIDSENIPTTIVWGYNQTLPIAKIEGGSYASISQYLQDIISKSNLDVDATSEQTLINALDALRKKAEMNSYQITTYTYNPLIGVTTITPPSGIREKYIYDSSNRLIQVIDINGKVLKENQYNYKH